MPGGIIISSSSGNVTINSRFSNFGSPGANHYERTFQTPSDITITTGSTCVLTCGADYSPVFVDFWEFTMPFGSGSYFNVTGNNLTILPGAPPGDYTLRAFVRNSSFSDAVYTSYIGIHVVGSPIGIGINPSGYSAVQTYYTDTARYSGYNNLPNRITVLTGVPITFNSVGNPGPLSNFNWQPAGVIPTYFQSPNGQATKQMVYAAPGSVSMGLNADNNGSPNTADALLIDVIWGPLTGYTLKFVTNLVEGWESLPIYNSTYKAPSDQSINTTTYKGWSGPIAAANQLDYFRRKQQPYGTQWFPDYIGRAATYDYMSLVWNWTDTPFPSPQGTETYNTANTFPAWRRFVLDHRYGHISSLPASYDQTGFGWWMNTSNLGWTLATNPNNVTYKGTSAKGLYDGLDAFYSHAGHSNVTFGMLKRTGGKYGTAPTEYVSGAENTLAAYKTMVQNLINNDKPFVILVSGNPAQPMSAPITIANAMVKTQSSIYNTPSTRHEEFHVNQAVAGATYSLSLYGYTVSYVATASDTTSSIATNLCAVVSATTQSQWSSGGSAPANGTPGFPPSVEYLSGNIFVIQLNTADHITASVTGASVSTNADDIPTSAMDASCGAEYIRTINARSLITTSPTFLTQNDDITSPLTPITPLPGMTDDQTTGNAYTVIGYCLPTNNTYLPSDARNKFLLICKETGSTRNINLYFALDAPLTSTAGDASLWDRLLGTYVVSPSQTTYVSPRVPLAGNPTGTQEACVGVPIDLVPPISNGTPHDNAFTFIYFGVGIRIFVAGPTTGRVFTTPGTYPFNYTLSDGVTHYAGSYSVVVNPTVVPQFTVSDSVGTPISGTPLSIATNATYNLTPTGTINPAFTYTWSITRTDAPGNSSNYTFVQGTPTTAGPVQIKFNIAGQYNITLTTSGSSGSVCPGQYTLQAKVDPVTLDFTYTSPSFFSLPINFAGICNVAVSSWAWTFGDGGTGSGQNTVHTYLSIGDVPVTLTVLTAYGYLSVTKILSIFPASAVADFIYSPLTGIVVGESVLFTDLSTPQPTPNGSITATWSWDFGDGEHSTAQNPSHAYGAPGIYNVTLTYTIFFGNPVLSRSNSITKQLTVESGAPVVKSQTFIVSRNLVNTFNLSNFVTSANPIQFTIDKMPTNGDVDNSDPINVLYQPNTNYIGPDVFTFRATDNFGLFATGNINLIVRPPQLQIIVGEIISDAGIITIRLGTAEVNTLLLKEVSIKNVGTGKLVITSMNIVDDLSSVFGLYDFSQNPVLGFNTITLDPKDVFSFYVGILASSVGTYKAKLQVIHN